MPIAARTGQSPAYGFRGAAINHGAGACISFGGLAADRAVEEAVLVVIQPGAVEAAIRAAEHVKADRKRDHEALALKLEQARYEAERARRRYDAAEPENRLVAAELEGRWNRALEVVAEVERERVAIRGRRVSEGREHQPDSSPGVGRGSPPRVARSSVRHAAQQADRP